MSASFQPIQRLGSNLYIVLGRALPDRTAASEQDEQRPRHFAELLAERFSTQWVAPKEGDGNVLDALCARLVGTRTMWAMARRLSKTLTKADTIFCSGEDVGFPLAAWLLLRRKRLRLLVMCHNINRPRARVALRAFAVRAILVFVVCSEAQGRFLKKTYRLPDHSVAYFPSHTDTSFFTQRPAPPQQGPQTIACFGLERRDFVTLCAAVKDLPVLVELSQSSADAKDSSARTPESMPKNVISRERSWREIRDVYRKAALVVAPILSNDYAAGVQAVLEGMASGCPVVATRTEGLAEYLSDDWAIRVPPNDAAALRRAIEELLQHEVRARALGDRGRQVAETKYSLEASLELFSQLLSTLPTRA